MAMKDAKGYSGGIVFVFTMAPGAGGCNLTPDPMKPSTLDVSVSGNVQCGQMNAVVNNGIAPYKLEVVPGYGQPKTLYFATNQFGTTLDMATGTQYFLVISDSAGHTSTSGLYTIEASSDSSCIGKAQTVTISMFSTLYPGSGTVLPTATPTSSNRTSSSSTSTSTQTPINQDFNGTHKSTQPMTIGLAVGISVMALALLAAMLLFYRRRRRRRRQTRPDAPTDGDYNPYGYDRPGYVVHPNFPQMHQSFGPLGTVYEEDQDRYPPHVVPELQAEAPGATPELGDGRAFQSPAVEYGNTIFAPRPISSHTSTSQLCPAPLSPEKSSQSRRLSQASDVYTVGSMEKPAPSAPSESDSSALLQQPVSTPWLGYGQSPGQPPMSPPPRGGTAATGTSSAPPAYEEAWL
ncbi:hypothetical protein FRC06_009479 [Ceratobasidium sp. 370]|nr:hypothetical protein FRC06_009479 [Ceratobasidium sp. 370]